MAGIKVMVGLEMPEPGVTQNPCKPHSVEDQVRCALDMIDSGYKSDVEWSMINRLYQDLCAMKKKSPRVQNLLNMIEPVLAKFGYHGVAKIGAE